MATKGYINNIQPDQIKKKIFSKMAILAKNGVRLVAFLTEVDFGRPISMFDYSLPVAQTYFKFKVLFLFLFLDHSLDFSSKLA